MSDHIDFQGGEFRGTVIGKAEYRQRTPAPTALDALPPQAAGFTGREEELTRLLLALNPASGTGERRAVLVAAVSGLGGIGKTALAVEAAYAAQEAGWFPGGVLFLDLHGYDDVPVTADQALQSLLRALGVEPEHVPATADERAGLYRSMLAERDTVLILADNASSSDCDLLLRQVTNVRRGRRGATSRAACAVRADWTRRSEGTGEPWYCTGKPRTGTERAALSKAWLACTRGPVLPQRRGSTAFRRWMPMSGPTPPPKPPKPVPEPKPSPPL